MRFIFCLLLVGVVTVSCMEEPETKPDPNFKPYPDAETQGSVDGDMFEGDILVKKGEKAGVGVVFRAKSDRNMVNGQNKRWPRVGRYIEVPYIFDSKVDANTKSKAQEAFKDYARWTCIKWVPRSNQKDYVKIFIGGGCYAYAGKYGGQQPLSLGNGCAYNKGTPTHEMMHTMGFMHEQSRSDRDRYIRVVESNMSPGAKTQFYKCTSCTLPNDKYDYGSVMHYYATAFSKNGKETIVTLDKSKTIGQRKGFSRLDIRKLNQMYSCGSTTVESNRGLTVPSETLQDAWQGCPTKKSRCADPHNNYQTLSNCEKSCQGVKKGDNFDTWDTCPDYDCTESWQKQKCKYSCGGNRL